ncbi:MAG TPA: DUF6599 family protein [Thermodesulfobacteriota bacterium]|nr:DUF6599 family protein [Thermodesulfobacteriota bacterium]
MSAGMKFLIGALLFIAAMASEVNGAEQGKSPDRPRPLTALLPAADEIPGWTISEAMVRAATESELYRIVDGAAPLYIRNGFRSFVAQKYRGPGGQELEVEIFDLGSATGARTLFDDPHVKPARWNPVSDIGEKARIDEGPLFCHVVDFIQDEFFVRVTAQEKSEESLKAAITFSRKISQRIP